MRLLPRRHTLLAILSVVVGCGGGGGVADPVQEPGPALDPLDVPQGCNPIAADWDCLLPFPSDHFRVDDLAMPSGHRLRYGDAGPKDTQGEAIDVTRFYPADGFSVAPPILAVFPEGVSATGLVSPADEVALSLGNQSPTVLLNAESGERIPHFAEVDPRPDDPARRALIIRPTVRLEHEVRYIVALRNLTSLSAEAIEPPEGFRRLRDDQTLGDPVLDPLARRYQAEIFGPLEAAQVNREELVLAWDFTTESLENTAGDMLRMRADAMERMERSPPSVTIDSVEDEVSEFIARRIEGTIEVPLYLEENLPNARLSRDSAGGVIANGSVDVPFLINIPHSVMEGQAPARLLQYGHGFLGDRSEINGGFIDEMAEQISVVVVAVDWWGMSGEDLFPLGEKLTQAPSEGLFFTDRVHQAMVNFMALTYASRGPLLEVSALQRGGGEPLYDPERISFYGLSQGHILGGTYMALSPHIERGVLGVGGAALTLIMFRALPFEPFLLLVELQIKDALEQQKWAAMVQTGFDRIDPITYAPLVLEEPLPGSPDRKVLMQLGLGDTSVPNLAGHLHARALGLSLLQPAPRSVEGLESVEAPFSGSALAEYDFGADLLQGLEADFPAEENDVHEALRRTSTAVEQIDAFLRVGGRVEHFCDGVCDPK